MKKKILTALLIFILFTIGVKAQVVSIRDFSVDSKYLQGNDIVLSKDPTPVEFKVTISSVKSISYTAKLQIQFAYVGQPLETTKEVYMSNNLIGNDGFYSTVIKVDIPKNRAGQLFKLNVRVEPTNGVPYDVLSNNTYKCIPQSTPTEPPIRNNTIIASGDTNFFDDFTINGTPPTGGAGRYTASWQIIGDNDQEINIWNGITSSVNLWEKDNTNYPPINAALTQSNIYLRRKIVSGAQISYSNKILIYDYTAANKNELIVKVQGRVNKNLGNGSVEKINEEIDANELVRGYFLDYKPDNMNPETMFRIANPTAGVRYKWAYSGYQLYKFVEGLSITTPVYLQGNLPPSAYKIEITGSDGSWHYIPLNTRR